MTGLIPLIQLIVNVGLLIAGSSGVIPANSAALAAALEAAAAPLLTALTSGGTATSQEIMAGFATVIGVLTALKNQTNLDPAILARVNQYTASSEAGVAGFLTSGKGFDPANYAAVPPAA